MWPVLCAGCCFSSFAVDMATNKTGANIKSTSCFGLACFTVVAGHCRCHSSGVCLLQQSSQLTQPGEDAHCVFAAGNWTERNAAMTQELHVDQGEMVDGRAATLGHRKITVRCRDTLWRDERHQHGYVEVLRTHATLLPTITSRVGRTVVRGPCAEALEQRGPQETGYATTRTQLVVLPTARQLIPTHGVCQVQCRTRRHTQARCALLRPGRHTGGMWCTSEIVTTVCRTRYERPWRGQKVGQ